MLRSAESILLTGFHHLRRDRERKIHVFRQGSHQRCNKTSVSGMLWITCYKYLTVHEQGYIVYGAEVKR